MVAGPQEWYAYPDLLVITVICKYKFGYVKIKGKERRIVITIFGTYNSK